MSINISSITKSFSNKRVYDNFSLKIKTGEILGIFGPNGCGKTTLLKIISGIMSFEAGKILINEEYLKPDNVESRRETYYLGHTTGFYKSLTATENLTFIANLYNKKNFNVEPILEKIGLDKNEKKQIRFFSKGMLQRLKIAACIILDCKILLLDEPIAGLDEKGIKLFYNLYEIWRESNKTILIVSHDINWLKKNTDRVLELN